MDVMEKLVELIANAKAMYADDYTDHTEDEYIAETLLDNFITVWDGKPIEEFLHPIDAYKGLKAKYLVFKADTGKRVDNCFILRPDKDPASVEALRAYAKATDNETLAKDIYNWVGNGVTVQECGEWIQHCFEIECTNCHQEALRDSFNKYVFSNYCPNCGAKMMPQPPKGE